jgi:ACS family sodium-dependent inorganic phosphate cotransporter
LTTKYGGKFFFGIGVGACSILSLLMPLAAYCGTFFIILLRMLQGLAQGFVFPSMHCMWSKWAPPNERSRLATFAFSGTHLGSVAALSFGGIIGEYLNWHSIFYIFGNFLNFTLSSFFLSFEVFIFLEFSRISRNSVDYLVVFEYIREPFGA